MKGLDQQADRMRPVVCIAGPTASGKTALAMRIARHVDGEVVNADALQVYADLQLLSARPTPDEMQDVPHHLFGHVCGDVLYSTGAWLREAVPVILDVLVRQKTPILVGGTGLYFKALLQGLADTPRVPAALESELGNMETSTLRAMAETLDPEATRKVLGHDPQRLVRIVGVAKSSGRRLSDWQADTRPVVPARFARRAVIDTDRAELYRRIDARFETMMARGALDEARSVRALGLPPRSPMLKAIGLSHLLSHLDGEMDLDVAIETAKRDTRRFAKRQSTWFRNQCADWDRLHGPQDVARFEASL